MFWAVILIQGYHFAGLFYDHDPKAFADRAACELTLPALEQRALQANDFMETLAEAADGERLVFSLKCIDTPPDRYEPEPLPQPKSDRT